MFASIFSGLLGAASLFAGGNSNKSNIEAQIQAEKLRSATDLAQNAQARLSQAQSNQLGVEQGIATSQQRALENQMAALREALLRRRM